MAEDNTQKPPAPAIDAAAIEAKFAQMQQTIDSQNAKIEGMKLKETNIVVEKKKARPIPEKAITVAGKEYKWTVPAFNHKGVKISAEDASVDEELLKEIVSITGQGILKEQA